MPDGPTKALAMPRMRLWALIEKRATKLTGKRVVALLAEASQAVWDAGIDKLYDESSDVSADLRSGAFDIMWMSIFLYFLDRELNNPCCCGGGCEVCT